MYRELLGLLYSITHFEPYIRENTFGSIILSDCSALSYLRQLKNHNTRLENVSNYISSFDDISFFHISGSSNFLSDSLTRQWSGTQIQIENQLNKSDLEKVNKIDTPDGTIIKPNQIKQLLCEPLDENKYKRTTVVKKINNPNNIAHTIINNLSDFTAEEHVIRASTHEFNENMKNHSFWLNETNKKSFTKTDFDNYKKKYKLDALRDTLTALCINVSQNDFSENTSNLFVKQLIKAASNELPDEQAEAIVSHCKVCLQNPSEDNINKLIKLYGNSSLYVHSDKYEKLKRIIPVDQPRNSDTDIRAKNGQIYIYPAQNITLKPEELATLNVDSSLRTKLHASFQQLDKNVIAHLTSSEFGNDFFLDNLHLFNPTNQLVHLTTNSPIGIILLHDAKESNCSCKLNNFTVTKIDGNRIKQSYPILQQLCNDTNVVLVHYIQAEVTKQNWRAMDLAKASHALQGNHCNIRSTYTMQKIDKSEALNQILLLSKALKNKYLTSKDILEMQRADNYIDNIRQQLYERNCDLPKFKLYNDIVCRRITSKSTGSEILAICLPDFATRLLLTSLHANMSMHLSKRAIRAFFDTKFYNPNVSKLLHQVHQECFSCTVQNNCNIRKTTGQHNESVAPGECFTLDLIENLPTSNDLYRYVAIAVDIATLYTVFIPLKNKTSEHFVKQFNSIFSLLGYPKKLDIDLGSSFAGKAFRNYATVRNIELHRPGAPNRHKANRAEGHVKLTRHFLTNAIISSSTGAKKYWNLLLPDINHAYNCTIPYANKNDLSRQTLFLARRPLNLITTIDPELFRKLSLDHLKHFKTSEKMYKNPPTNSFKPGQLVKIIQTKEDLTSETPSGLKPNQCIFGRILDVSKVSCRVLILNNNIEKTMSYEALRALSLEDIHDLHSFPDLFPDQLASVTPRQGKFKTIYDAVTSEYKHDIGIKRSSTNKEQNDESKTDTQDDEDKANEHNSNDELKSDEKDTEMQTIARQSRYIDNNPPDLNDIQYDQPNFYVDENDLRRSRRIKNIAVNVTKVRFNRHATIKTFDTDKEPSQINELQSTLMETDNTNIYLLHYQIYRSNT